MVDTMDILVDDMNIDIKLSNLQLKLKEYKLILAVLEKDKDLRDSERERLGYVLHFYFHSHPHRYIRTEKIVPCTRARERMIIEIHLVLGEIHVICPNVLLFP